MNEVKDIESVLAHANKILNQTLVEGSKKIYF